MCLLNENVPVYRDYFAFVGQLDSTPKWYEAFFMCVVNEYDLLSYCDDSVGSRNAGPPHIKVGHAHSVRSAHGAGPYQALKSKAPVVDSIGAFSLGR